MRLAADHDAAFTIDDLDTDTRYHSLWHRLSHIILMLSSISWIKILASRATLSTISTPPTKRFTISTPPTKRFTGTLALPRLRPCTRRRLPEGKNMLTQSRKMLNSEKSIVCASNKCFKKGRLLINPRFSPSYLIPKIGMLNLG